MEIEREERNGSGYQEKQEFITGIYYEYERLMFATARRYIDDRTEQEDVVQESLKKLIEKQERLAGLAQAAQAGYVATTVRNTAISILREKTKGKDKILSLDALGEDALRRYMIPIREEEMIRQEMARQLREGLEHTWSLRSVPFWRGNTSWLRVTRNWRRTLNASLTAFG